MVVVVGGDWRDSITCSPATVIDCAKGVPVFDFLAEEEGVALTGRFVVDLGVSILP